MSAINGDKARFNRDRKKKIARRLRNQAKLSSAGKSKGRPTQQKEGSA